MIETYIIENVDTGKKYVGITSVGLSNRFHKHYTNAIHGIDTYFYRSIRLYGIGKFSIKRVDVSDSWEEAYASEKYHIQRENTLVPHGYNITNGGSGGGVINCLPEDKLIKYLKYRKVASTKENNGNYSGYSDEDLITVACNYFNELGYIGGPRVWINFAKENGYPQTFSKNRFGGSYSKFIELVQHRTHLPILKNKKTQNHIEKIRKRMKGSKWVNNGTHAIQIHDGEVQSYIDNGYTLGRIKKC